MPDILLAELKQFFDNKNELKKNDHIWPFSKRTGHRAIKKVMANCNIKWVRAWALGLRHGLAVHAVSKVPQSQVQRWMGHAYISTTSIYLEVSGREEREWAKKTW